MCDKTRTYKQISHARMLAGFTERHTSKFTYEGLRGDVHQFRGTKGKHADAVVWFPARYVC